MMTHNWKPLFLPLLTIAALVLTTFGVACGSERKKAPAAIVISGRLMMTPEEETSEKLARKAAGRPEPQAGKMESADYESLSAMLMALKAGRVTFACLPRDVSDYIVKRNPELTVVDDYAVFDLKMAVRPDAGALRDQLNAALDALVREGTLEQLTTRWIKDLPADSDPEPGQLPVFAGAPTIRIGVTGDMPPMDFVSADGTPSGFNVALLGAIAEKARLNLVLVPVTAQARVQALNSRRIDVIFWMRSFGTPKSDAKLPVAGIYDDRDRNVLMTDSYYSGVNSFLTKDYPPELILNLFQQE